LGGAILVTDEVEGTTEGEATQQWPPQDQEAGQEESETEGGVKLRVAGLPYMESFTMGDTTITRHGTVVPEDQAQEILTAAQNAGYTLEVVPE
jgi:hypothetical protein